MADNIIRCRNMSREFQMADSSVRALRDVNLDIARGEFIAVVGPSGSGKSTLLYVLGALDKSTGGEISVNGKDLTSMSEREKASYRNQDIGFVFQDFNLMGHMSALENVEMPLVFAGTSPRERTKRARKALVDVGLADRITHLPGELSGGQQQRVAIARAIVTEPRLLFADEPTGNMDSETGRAVVDLIAALAKDKGITVVVVTHNEMVSSAADRRFSMVDGRLTEIE